jgi:HEAT repeat protein
MGIVVAGLGVVVVGIWALSRTLGTDETRYQGKRLDFWREQLASHEAASSNQAYTVLNSLILPRLTNQMFSDTNDSRFRVALIDGLNGLPGVNVHFVPADGRRVQAVNELGSLGPGAKPATPALIEVLKRKEDLLCGPAAAALVQVQADPELVIPALIDCLIDPDGHGRPDVVEALGEFGPKAKAAVPLLVKLLEDHSSKEIVRAVPQALRKIDPEAAARAGVK